MPTVTVDRTDLTKEMVATALQEQLGNRYTVEAREGKDSVHVGQSALAFAYIRLARDGRVTKLHVHGGGFVIGRLINELTIARKVATALSASGLFDRS